MNISEESPYDIVAKTCECENRGRKVTYSLIDAHYSLCHDKKDLILGQIEACQRLVKYIAKDGRDEIDRRLGPNSVNYYFIVVTNVEHSNLVYVSIYHFLVLVIISAKCDVDIFYG